MENKSFPEDFLFGVSTSAYQIEGGYKSDGKGENVWDYYTNQYPERFKCATGNVACDSYRKYKEDVELISDLGVNFYRFSVSWSRILPNGYCNIINQKGIQYYNNLIDALLEKGIQPMITMYHWDLPMPLQKIGGWTNPLIVQCFKDYARILFTYFGDRVKLWITVNKTKLGYADDEFPPFINQSGIADYLLNHYTLLAHAATFHMYNAEFREKQKGKVGVVLDARWYTEGSKSVADLSARERVRDFEIGLFLNPLCKGDYPEIAKQRIAYRSQEEGYPKSRMPDLTPEEVELVKGSFDFLGLNIYTTVLVEDIEEADFTVTSDMNDMKARLYQDSSWESSEVAQWLKVTPAGARNVLKWVKDRYGDPEIIITENGFADSGQIHDSKRIQYLQKYLTAILDAILIDGVRVKGYSAWSLLDNFEWISGYSEKFGLVHVDFCDPERKRSPKKSAEWYRNLIRERVITK
nr:unnamed protein product [Callosobruchus chinensis]